MKKFRSWFPLILVLCAVGIQASANDATKLVFLDPRGLQIEGHGDDSLIPIQFDWDVEFHTSGGLNADYVIPISLEISRPAYKVQQDSVDYCEAIREKAEKSEKLMVLDYSQPGKYKCAVAQESYSYLKGQLASVEERLAK